MKNKKFYSVIAAIAIACSQAVVPAFAEGAAINGDWVDTSSMTPVYESESVTTTNYGAVFSEDCAGDSIMEFSVEMKGNYQIHSYYNNPYFNGVLIQTSWGNKNATTGLTNQENGKHIQYHYYNTSTAKAANGWLTGADATYPKYAEGAKIAFRVQVKNGVVSTWAADLDDAEGKAVEAPVYCYLGSYTYPAGKYSTEPGSARLYTTAAQTLTDVKIYSLSSSAIVDITGANAAKLVLSDAPSQELAAGDITLTDSFGKVIAATGIEKVSDTEYALAFAESLKAGVIYSADVDAVNAIGGGYLENSDYYMDAALNLDFNDESWKDYVGVYASGNINKAPTGALCKNNQIELQETYAIITNDTYESNSIIEFDGMITSNNTAGEGSAYLQINKNAESYSETNTEHNYNAFRIFYHSTGKKPQYFKRQDGKWAYANKTFSDNVIVNNDVMYNFRIVTEGTKVSLYMKEATSNGDYVLAGTYTNADMKTNDGRIELSANNTSSANGANYDNIRVYETNSNAIAAMHNNVITVDYSVEPAEVLTAENIQVTKSDDSAATVSSVTRTGVTTYEIALEDVVVGETYTVSSAVKNIYGADLKDAEIVAPEQEKLGFTLIPGVESTKAVITGATMAPDATVIFAVYNSTGLENVDVKNMSEIDAETNSFTFGGVAEGQTCALYIWDSLTGMVPLVK